MLCWYFKSQKMGVKDKLGNGNDPNDKCKFVAVIQLNYLLDIFLKYIAAFDNFIKWNG